MRDWINLCEGAIPADNEELVFPKEFPQQGGRYTLTPEIDALVRRMRHQCRIDNGGGGACHMTSEILEAQYGFERVEGWYCHTDGRIICSHHMWNETPDGAIIDVTADQFGEDEGVRIIYPDDPLYERYRVRWGNRAPVRDDEHADEIQRRGEDHATEQNRENEKSGTGWWLTDQTRFAKYTSTNVRYD